MTKYTDADYALLCALRRELLHRVSYHPPVPAPKQCYKMNGVWFPLPGLMCTGLFSVDHDYQTVHQLLWSPL